MEMKKLRWLLGIILGVLLALAVTAFVIYRHYFNGEITSDHVRWAEFGDYVSGIAGILNFVAFVGLTIIIGIIEKHSADRDVRVRAQELMMKKIQSANEEIHKLSIEFQLNPTADIANKTLEKIQPILAYLYFVRNVEFLPQVTKNKIGETRTYLLDASNLLHEYALNINNNQSIVIRAYNEIYRRFAELEVIILTNIASDYNPNDEITFDDRLANQRNNP